MAAMTIIITFLPNQSEQTFFTRDSGRHLGFAGRS
jgi:hypothetical protein